MRIWRIGLTLHIPLPDVFFHSLVDFSASMCMACLNGFIDPLPTLSRQTQNLLAEVCELRLVAKDFLVLWFIVALDSCQVILVHSNSLFFAHSFEFDSIIVLISLSLLLFFYLAILFETFCKSVFVFVDAVKGPCAVFIFFCHRSWCAWLDGTYVYTNSDTRFTGLLYIHTQ